MTITRSKTWQNKHQLSLKQDDIDQDKQRVDEHKIQKPTKIKTCHETEKLKQNSD